METLPINLWLVLVCAYLLGSIPFGLLLAKWLGKGDLRNIGSGNIGATNAVRAGGKKLGALVLMLDAGKGALAILLASFVTGPDWLPFAVGALVVLGHCFPIWLKFKGGKGVATTLAVLGAIHWPIGLATVAVWLLAFMLTRLSSLAAIMAMLAVPLFGLVFGYGKPETLLLLCLFLPTLVILRHHSNIRRLVSGEEFGFRSKR